MVSLAPVGRYSWMKVVDVMTAKLLTVSPTDTIGQAEQLMNEKRIRQLPVVQGRELLGIVTDRDIRAFLSAAILSHYDQWDKALNTQIREIMTTDPLTLSPDDDLRDAVALLIEEKIGGIPVVDEVEGLVGIVTYVDILRCFLNRLQED